jgi:F-type H+-transporting ATPase subunit epsilon
MKLEIVTPEKTITEDNIQFVSMEGLDGSFGVLPGHIPLIAELKIAPMFFRKEKGEEFIAVMGGIARVLSDKVTIVTEGAERATEIDVLTAKKEKEAAEAYLSRKAEISDILKAEAELHKALTRLKVVEVSKRI